MLFNHDYPYTDFHELNLDWILCKMKELDSSVSEFTTLNKLQWCGTWDITKSYSAWSLVEDGEGNGYVSTGPVPAGIQLDNTKYWQKVANYSSLYAAFEQRIGLLEDGEAEIKTQLNAETAAREAETDERKTADLTLYKKIESTVSNIGIILTAQNHITDSNSDLVNWSMQGFCYDTKRDLYNVGCTNNTSTGLIVVLNSNFEYQKTYSVSDGYHINDLDYNSDTDTVCIAANNDSKLRWYKASDFSFVESKTYETGGHYIFGVTHDEKYIYFITWKNNKDIPLYRCLKTSTDAEIIGNLYDKDAYNFTMYPGLKNEDTTYFQSIQYLNNSLYTNLMYLNESSRWNVSRYCQYDLLTGKFKTCTDDRRVRYEEDEGITVDSHGNLISCSYFSDWTENAHTVFWNFRTLTINTNTDQPASVPKNVTKTFTITAKNNTTVNHTEYHIPPGKYLVILSSDDALPYEANRYVRVKLSMNNAIITNAWSPYGEYFRPSVNIVNFYSSQDPFYISVDVMAITTSQFDITFNLQLIAFTDSVVFGETSS